MFNMSNIYLQSSTKSYIFRNQTNMFLDHWVINVVSTGIFFIPKADLSSHNCPLCSVKGGVQSPSNPFELHRAHLWLHSSHVWFISVICALVVLLTDLQTTHTGETLLSAFFPL